MPTLCLLAAFRVDLFSPWKTIINFAGDSDQAINGWLEALPSTGDYIRSFYNNPEGTTIMPKGAIMLTMPTSLYSQFVAEVRAWLLCCLPIASVAFGRCRSLHLSKCGLTCGPCNGVRSFPNAFLRLSLHIAARQSCSAYSDDSFGDAGWQ